MNKGYFGDYGGLFIPETLSNELNELEKLYIEIKYDKDFNAVVERANNNELGLASYIYTNDMKKANRASELMESGTVAVNTPVVAVAEAPLAPAAATATALATSPATIASFAAPAALAAAASSRSKGRPIILGASPSGTSINGR